MKTQRGAALMMGLMLLLVLTLLAVSAVNMSTVNLRIVGNMQAVQQAEVAVDTAIETAMTTPANFTDDKDKDVEITIAGVGKVVVKPRKCLYSKFIEDTSADYQGGEIALWQVEASYIDPLSNTPTTIVKGVKRIMEGNSNCLPSP